MPQDDAKALCDLIARIHNASDPSDVERCLRQLALAWEDYYLPKFPIPFFQVRVADVRAAGGSLSTALELYDEVRGVSRMSTVKCDTVAMSIIRCFTRSIPVRMTHHWWISSPTCGTKLRGMRKEAVSVLPVSRPCRRYRADCIVLISSIPYPSSFHLAHQNDNLRFFQNWKHARAFATPFSWPMLPNCAPDILNTWRTYRNQRQLLNYCWLQALNLDQCCELTPEVRQRSRSSFHGKKE